MSRVSKERIDMLQRGIKIAKKYHRAKCFALRGYARVYGFEATFEEELRPHYPHFDTACKDWYEWLREFTWLYQQPDNCLWNPQTDWDIREY
jgi:hypothetical protein